MWRLLVIEMLVGDGDVYGCDGLFIICRYAYKLTYFQGRPPLWFWPSEVILPLQRIKRGKPFQPHLGVVVS